MKKTVQVFSYIVAIVMFFGVLAMIDEQSFDAYSFIAFGLFETQAILTLIYISKK